MSDTQAKPTYIHTWGRHGAPWGCSSQDLGCRMLEPCSAVVHALDHCPGGEQALGLQKLQKAGGQLALSCTRGAPAVLFLSW